MPFRHSLRSRIIIAFCLFGTVLGVVYAISVYISLDYIDDHLIDNRLNEEVKHFIAYHQRYSDYPRQTSPHITAYIGTELMPLYVLKIIDGIAEGFHEVYFDEREYHIAIQRLPAQQNLLYLLCDVSSLEFTEKRKLGISLDLAAGVILMVALGSWIGWLTSRKVMEPVVHLAQQVHGFGPEKLPTDLSKNFINDEVGVLAKVLEKAMRRVEAFVEREQQFNRYASHELRTPVTVIKGSLELLKKKFSSCNDKSVNRPLERIERSAENMEKIIETLLWLSREDVAVDLNQNFAVVPVVREAIEQHRYLIGNKPVDIEFIPENEPKLTIPVALFQIAISNLIRNALQHTLFGTISVIVKNDRVLVADTGTGIETDDLKRVTQPYVRGEQSDGFGLGLSIVKRLCDQLDWDLEIESELEKGTKVELIFRTAPA